MRSKLFLGFVLGGLSFAAFGACGGSDSETTGAGGSTSASSSATTTSSHASTSSTSGVTTGSGGSGTCTPSADNHTFATAADITLDMQATPSCLPDPTTAKDYYKFTGTKGQGIGIFGFAKTVDPNGNPFDPAIVDLTVTLYDSTQKQVAFQDDPFPRTSNDPALFTVLPADGTYYVEVADCNAVLQGCYDPTMITTFDYQIGIGNLTGAGDIKESPEPNETTGAAAAIPYTKDMTSMQYPILLLDGSFKDGTDIDVYSFMLPADVNTVMGSRVHADFWLQTSGATSGDGATSSIGNVWATQADGTTVIAKLDGSLYGDVDNPDNGPADLSVPVQTQTQYYLFVQHPSTAAGTNDFYFIEHFGGTFYANPVETQEMANNVATTAEPLMQQDNMDGSFSYFVEGDLVGGPADTDYFSMTVPAGTAHAVGSCSAGREGSGLQGFTFALTNPDGSAITGASATEDLSKDLGIGSFTSPIAIPSGATTVLLKLTATGQDTGNTGSYYRCGVTFVP